MAKKKKDLKKTSSELNSALNAKCAHGEDALYEYSPVMMDPTSMMGVKMDNTWVSELQVSDKFKEIGYQVVDDFTKEHQQ